MKIKAKIFLLTAQNTYESIKQLGFWSTQSVPIYKEKKEKENSTDKVVERSGDLAINRLGDQEFWTIRTFGDQRLGD